MAAQSRAKGFLEDTQIRRSSTNPGMADTSADSERWVRAWDANESGWYWYDVRGELESVWESEERSPEEEGAPAWERWEPSSLTEADPAIVVARPELRLDHPEVMPLGFAAVVVCTVSMVQLLACTGKRSRTAKAPALVSGSIFRSGTGEAVLVETEPCPGGLMLLSNAPRTFPGNVVATFGAVAAACLFCAVAVLWHCGTRHWQPPPASSRARSSGSGGTAAAFALALPLSLLSVALLLAHVMVDGENHPRTSAWTGRVALALLWAALACMDRLRLVAFRARLAAMNGDVAVGQQLLGFVPVKRHDNWRLCGRLALLCGCAATVLAWVLPASWRERAIGSWLQLVAVLLQACCVASLAPEIATADSGGSEPTYAKINSVDDSTA